ncbi:hypothetical protein DdX_20165 [Ditylenchus destructor]|uniref:Uncharacterized protein n=1 Tax=Ditylenchus destructor TaxID=166010 RepID=A0AAD4MHQ1_9BILA|nr:hypothetical protein DdX_20165 [Ditylenchus destructor]
MQAYAYAGACYAHGTGPGLTKPKHQLIYLRLQAIWVKRRKDKLSRAVTQRIFWVMLCAPASREKEIEKYGNNYYDLQPKG